MKNYELSSDSESLDSESLDSSDVSLLYELCSVLSSFAVTGVAVCSDMLKFLMLLVLKAVCECR